MRRKSVIFGGVMIVLGSAGAALAEPTMTGTVATLDRTTGTIVLRETPSGTIGSSSTNPETSFRLQIAVPEGLHAGDRVKVIFTETNGTKVITKLDEVK